MPTNFVSDTLTDTAGTLLTAHTGETGATWVRGTSFAAVAPPVIDDTGGRIRPNSASNSWLYASGVATVDGEFAEAVFDVVTNVGQLGVAIRASATRGYTAHIGSGILRILRLEANGSFAAQTLTAGGTSISLTPSVGQHTVKIQASGTGASVFVEVWYDGVSVASCTDSSASRITTLGSVGLMPAGTSSDTTGLHVASIVGTQPDEGGGTSITANSPAVGRIYQRAAGVATVGISGTYTGTPTSIERQMVLTGTSTVVSGFDWATAVASPAGGTFSFDLVDIPHGDFYDVQTRDSAVPGTVYTYGPFGAGDLHAITGQSNGYRLFRYGDSTLTAHAKTRVFGNIGTWGLPTSASMNGAIAMANALQTAANTLIGLIDGAWDGSGLTISNSGATGAGKWGAPAANAYTAFKAIIDGIGGKLTSVTWIQGETEAKLSPGTTAYFDAATTLFALMRSDFTSASMPIVVAALAKRTDGTVTDADTETIRLAHAQLSDAANNYRVERYDLALTDGVHHTNTAYSTFGTRLALAVNAALGLVAQYRGPRITAATRVSATEYDLTLVHGAGTDFTPTSGITGIDARDGASQVTVSSDDRTSATNIRVVLASDPAAIPTFGAYYGATPVITGVVKDNSSFALPLEYSAPIAAIEGTLVSSDLAGSYSVNELVSANLPGSYAVSSLVGSELDGSYGVHELVSSDLAASYGIAAFVSADLAGSYSISSATTLVSSDLAGSYGVSALVYADLSGAYAIESNVTFTRAPAGGGYTPQRIEIITRPAATQRNAR